MKLIKVTLLLIVVVLNFASCQTTQFRIHTRELRAELSKYSDVLDLARTEIYLKGGSYHFFASSLEDIFLSLYLKPDYNNHEALFAIRDTLIDFFHNNRQEIRGRYSFPRRIAIRFILGETETSYIAVNILDGNGRNLNLLWYELWCSETVFGQYIKSYFRAKEYAMRFGKPFIGRTINNGELNTLFNNFDIEQFGCHYASIRGGDYIRMWLLIPGNCNYDSPGDYDRETVIAIINTLVDFFDDNQQKFIKEYGRFDTIYITFYMMVNSRYPTAVHYIRYENNEWVEWLPSLVKEWDKHTVSSE